MQDQAKFIDIDNVFKSKSPGAYKLIPKFIIRYLKKITHQDELNDAIARNHEKYGADFAAAMIEEFNVKLDFSGDISRLKEDRLIVAGNHPLGGLDGLALMTVAGMHRKDFRFIVNDLLLNVENLKDFFIPVNKYGSNPKEAILKMDHAYASDMLILTFPAGLCSRKRNGEVCDLEWKKSFISKARQYQRNIVPVFIDGENSSFFYRLSNVRKCIGIKQNLEMLYLVDEMFRQKGKTIRLHFGETIPWQTFDRKKTDPEWAGSVKQIVYGLKK